MEDRDLHCGLNEKYHDVVYPPSGVSSHNPVLQTQEVECSMLREKLENYQITIKQLQRELQSQQSQKSGTETIVQLLREVREDLVVSQKRAKGLEVAVNNLQSRLEQHGLSSNVELEEDEVFIPGPSKQIMDNLVKENSRLRTLLRNSSSDPEEVHSLRQQLQELQDHTEDLTKENLDLKEENYHANSVIKSSESEKDHKITELSWVIEKRQHDIQKYETVLKSLSEESMELRKQLKEVAFTCQQMALKLDEKSKTENSFQERMPTTVKEFKVEDQDEISKLRDENGRLTESVQSLEEMNRRWKSYNDQRESFVQRLQYTVQELQVNLQAAQANHMSEEKQKHMENTLVTSRQKLEMVASEKQQLQTRLTTQENETKSLQEAYSIQGEELRKATQRLERLPTQQHTQEDIGALKAQIQICTEDFDSERKDREKAQSRLTELEQENQMLRREISRVQQEVAHQQMIAAPPPRHQSMNIPTALGQPHHNYNQIPRYNIEPEQRLMARGAPVKPLPRLLVPQMVTDGGQVEEDSPASERKNKDSNRPDKSLKKVSRTLMEEMCLLQCPKCKKEYDSNKHNELLEHIEICCE